MKTSLPANTSAGAARVQIAPVGAALPRRAQMGRIATALEDERILGFVLLSPALILILVFIAYPFVLGIWMSLTDKLVGTPGNFVGLSNYARLLQSDIFRTAAWNTLFFTFMATVFKAALGMWLAILLNRKFRLARITRATVLLPFIVPTVLSTLAYQLGMTSGNIGQGAAVALFMLPFLASVIVFQLWYLRRQGVR